MYSSAQPPRPAGARQTGIRLALCLLPAVAISSPSVAPETGRRAASRPYLTAVAAPALRFADPRPAPDLSVKPPGGAPPLPSTTTDLEPPVLAPTAPDSPSPAKEPGPAADAPAPDAPVKPPAVTPPSILPDDTRSKVRPEDFLPFFQFPGSAANPDDVTVVVPGTLTPPAPGTLPPSSATYRQQ